MPVYLAHGFRWPRDGVSGIRAHVIFNNMEDVATEYIQSEQAKSILRQKFRDLYPSQMMQLEDPRTGKTLEFLEQYDPEDEVSDTAASQTYAYVCDRVITIADRNAAVPASAHTSKHDRPPKTSSSDTPSPVPGLNPCALSLNVEEAMSRGPAVTPQAWEALAELRDKLAEGEKIGWWVVYNGDPDRSYDTGETETEYDEEADEEEEVEGARTPTQSEPYTNGILGQPVPSMLPPDLRRLVLEENKANQSLIGTAIPHPPPPPPPLERPPPPPNGATTPRPKSSRSFSNPLKKRSSKANLQPSSKEEIPEPPKLKEMSRKEGFRSKFFGRAIDKKPGD